MNRWLGGLLLGLLLSGLALAEQRLTFSVPFAANLDLDREKLAAVLASPAVQVQVSYQPALAVLGWTGRFGYCSPRHICIKKKWKTLVLSADAVQREGDRLSISLPRTHWFGPMRYRLAGPVRVVLPPFWPEELPGNIDLDLATLEGEPHQTVVDLHLVAPYVGVGALRVDAPEAVGEAKPYAVPACDATLEATEAGPRIRPHRQAEAYMDWLRRLAESDWWATQIPGVGYERLAGLPAELGAVASDVRRVTVDRGGDHLRLLRARVERLEQGACAGSTQYEFAWLNGRLIGAAAVESPDIFGPDSCAQIGNAREALWWQGRLERYSGPGEGGQVRQWDRWRAQDASCLAKGAESGPSAEPLERAATLWWRFSESASALSGKKEGAAP